MEGIHRYLLSTVQLRKYDIVNFIILASGNLRLSSAACIMPTFDNQPKLGSCWLIATSLTSAEIRYYGLKQKP